MAGNGPLKQDAGHQQKYADAIKEARLAGDDSFQSWFNKSQNINESVLRGYWDMTVHILNPRVVALIESPEEKTALEIGHGGGRILNAACSYFKEVIGIDIHNENETVEAFLKSQSKSNFRLIKGSGATIDADSQSIDFIYSFIVLQHLPSFNTFVSYLKETYRCLKTGGVAQLYFGTFSKLGPKDRLRYYLQGYKEITDAPVNTTSLVVRVAKVKKVCKDIGFKVSGDGISYKTVPDGYPKIRGGQNYITLLK